MMENVMNQVAVANIQSRLPMPSGLIDLDAGKWPGINEIQVTASRTGKYAGMDEPKWGPDKTQTFKGVVKWKEGNAWKEEAAELTITFPEWCGVTVYRMIEGQRCAFTEPVYWIEAYARRGKTEVPNDMWAKRTRGQLLKVAKAFSLRAAFPEEGEYTAEEMEGKEIESGGIVIDNTPIKPSPFKTAVARNQFCNNVIKSFDDAKNKQEMLDILDLNKPKFEEMDESGNEYDALGTEELRKRYKIRWNAIHRAEAISQEDSSFDPEEIPMTDAEFAQAKADGFISKDEMRY